MGYMTKRWSLPRMGDSFDRSEADRYRELGEEMMNEIHFSIGRVLANRLAELQRQGKEVEIDSILGNLRWGSYDLSVEEDDGSLKLYITMKKK